MQQVYISAFSPEEQTLEPTHCGVAEVLATKYNVADVNKVADAQVHLMPTQRHKLKSLLRQFPKLFSGKLGLYPHQKIHLELQKDAKPVRR